jgi:MerR family transcriptional regulator, light-induced transcriptional regulator
MVSVFQQFQPLPDSARPSLLVRPRSTSRQTARPAAQADKSVHRSGAVARMLGMPVATLRVWERRYALCQPQLTPSGQRLYSASDVRRLAMIKQLTERGHAIGSLAELNVAQLQAVVQTHLSTVAQRQDTLVADDDIESSSGVNSASLPAWRVALVGAAWTARLAPPKLLRSLGRPWQLLGPFKNLAQVEKAAKAAKSAKAQPIDAVLVHEAGVHADWLAQLHKHSALRGLPLALLYAYAAEPVCEQLAAAGVALLQEPQSNTVMAQWLRGWCGQASQTAAPPAKQAKQKKPTLLCPPHAGTTRL